MSVDSGKTRRTTIPELVKRKGGPPIAVLTAYTAPMATWLDEAVDALLVGDSLGQVIYGFETTLPVTLDMMEAHAAAVVRGSKRAAVIVDMPFGAYQESKEAAFRAAARLLANTGAQAVKFEGGMELVETCRFLVERGIPVMAHVGLRPQAVNALGGYKSRGRSDAEADALLAQGHAYVEAGAFSLLIEGVVEPVARRITEAVPVPTIGIGASAACDGQVLVIDDLLGTFGSYRPRFAKAYLELGPQITAAAKAYAEEVRTRRFPGPEHVVTPKPHG